MANLLLTFNGRNGTGGIGVNGVQAGDRLVSVYEITNPGTNSLSLFGGFAPSVSTIYQSSSADLSALDYVALIERDDA